MNFGGGDSDPDTLINVDVQGIATSIKVLPSWAKILLSLFIAATCIYFIMVKTSIYTDENTRIEVLTESSIKVDEKIEEVQNILYNYNIILKYYETTFKIIILNQSMNLDRQQMIVDYLGTPQTSENYEYLLRRLNDNNKNKNKIEELYEDLRYAEDNKEISRILDNIDHILNRNIKSPKILNQ